MDLNTVTSYRLARSREDLALAPGEKYVAGGTWVFSDPDPTVLGLVDLTALGWPDLEYTDNGGRSIAGTCPIGALSELAHPLFAQCADALLASRKVSAIATVGGNLGRSFAAASMVSLLLTLDAEAVIWTPGGGERRMDVIDLPTGNGTNSLAHGEVIRSLEIPGSALLGRTAYAKIALARFGRSGAVVTARLDADGSFVVVVTAATYRGRRLRYRQPPTESGLRTDLAQFEEYYTDPLGSADWRRAVTGELACRVMRELVEPA